LHFFHFEFRNSAWRGSWLMIRAMADDATAPGANGTAKGQLIQA
jgi:hypothetical protein